MLVIKYILLFLSLMQYIQENTFWQGAFIWFFIWVILFHINWFYLEQVKYKQINSILLTVTAVINIIVLPTIPFIMIGLLTMELRQIFSRRNTLIILGLLLLSIIVANAMIGKNIEVEYVVYTIGLIILGGYITEQNLTVNQQEDQLYEFQKQVADSNENVLSLKAQMVAMEEIHTLNERNRISRDLHDSVGHTLSTIVVQLAAIAKVTEESSPQASSMLKQLHQFAKEGLANVRSVIHHLKPTHYQKIAFIEQVHNIITDFERNGKIRVYFNHNQLLWELSPEQEIVFIRAIQEFLSNSNKHSDATEVRIQCHFTDSSVILTMSDNGQGVEVIKPQMGMTGMQERTKLLGGKVNLQSAIGKGFKVRIVLPKGGHAHVRTN